MPNRGEDTYIEFQRLFTEVVSIVDANWSTGYYILNKELCAGLPVEYILRIIQAELPLRNAPIEFNCFTKGSLILLSHPQIMIARGFAKPNKITTNTSVMSSTIRQAIHSVCTNQLLDPLVLTTTWSTLPEGYDYDVRNFTDRIIPRPVVYKGS